MYAKIQACNMLICSNIVSARMLQLSLFTVSSHLYHIGTIALLLIILMFLAPLRSITPTRPISNVSLYTDKSSLAQPALCCRH